MNVSGLNIDLGNLKAPTSSTWPIPNNSITPIPPNPTNTQMNVSEGPEAHLKSHQRLIPNQNFHVSSSLILVRIQSNPRIPLDKVNSQPSIFHQDLRFMWEIKNMAPKHKSVHSQEPIEHRDELYASSPVVHKGKVTGRHHPHASKPRNGHASSSRESIVDYEDENMSPTQSERNDE
ncbi:hypothetical protein O181_106365 [Austropuccinia psidii MF-1]|uniref:Uncharacterized protein n=1 Tax=Austropuccinia psidii MF-1 TaxID=1389203 RepID=A0A9Q3JSD3_9BASI|nr:hypothetical protein [Austropuccinia psidii MF-1]